MCMGWRLRYILAFADIQKIHVDVDMTIKQLGQDVERVTERLTDKNPCNDCKIDRQIGNPNRWECECDRCSKPYEWKNDCIKKLAEYETAEEEGRLVVLPCKVGDIVYKIMCQRDNFDDRPYRIITSVNFRLDMADDIGKTVFLTREEAEKELREMEGK